MATTIEETETAVAPEAAVQGAGLPELSPAEIEANWIPKDILAGDASLDLVPPLCGTLVAITAALLTRAGRRRRTRFIYGLAVFLAGAAWAYYLVIRPRLRNEC